jgi:hypothetical protein
LALGIEPVDTRAGREDLSAPDGTCGSGAENAARSVYFDSNLSGLNANCQVLKAIFYVAWKNKTAILDPSLTKEKHAEE